MKIFLLPFIKLLCLKCLKQMLWNSVMPNIPTQTERQLCLKKQSANSHHPLIGATWYFRMPCAAFSTQINLEHFFLRVPLYCFLPLFGLKTFKKNSNAIYPLPKDKGQHKRVMTKYREQVYF